MLWTVPIHKGRGRLTLTINGTHELLAKLCDIMYNTHKWETTDIHRSNESLSTPGHNDRSILSIC